MLHEFLTKHREEILKRTRSRVTTRTAPKPTHEELTRGVPLFLDQLIAILSRAELDSDDVTSDEVINQDATHHGEDRQQTGFSVEQVVRDYGDLCQIITQLAIDLEAPIGTDEFKTLNGCLDDAIAKAVSKFARVREVAITDDELQRLGFLAHEMRNLLQTASLAYEVLKEGAVGISGSTGAVLGRSLEALQRLVDNTLTQVWLDAGIHHRERVEMVPFMEEIEAAGSMLANDCGMSLSIERGSPGVAVEADRHLLGSAVSNLLQNAFKFTHANGHVSVSTSATSDRVVIEVEDQCGSVLEPGQLDALFEVFEQSGPDKSGLGLGLAITKKAIETMGGAMRARNADAGCVFTIDLPRLIGSPDRA
jgi:signal transduction histidine kinase